MSSAIAALPRRIGQITDRLARIASVRRELCRALSQLDDDRGELLTELEQLDRRAFRAGAL